MHEVKNAKSVRRLPMVLSPISVEQLSHPSIIRHILQHMYQSLISNVHLKFFLTINHTSIVLLIFYFPSLPFYSPPSGLEKAWLPWVIKDISFSIYDNCYLKIHNTNYTRLYTLAYIQWHVKHTHFFCKLREYTKTYTTIIHTLHTQTYT